MGVRVYELSKKYGVENAVLIEKLHSIGYKSVKQPSNTIDKITAEFLVKELGLVEKTPPPPPPTIAGPAPAAVGAPKPPAAPPAPAAPPPPPRQTAVPPLGVAKALMQTVTALRPAAPGAPLRTAPPTTATPVARHVGPSAPTRPAMPAAHKFVAPAAPTTPGAPAIATPTAEQLVAPASLARAHIPPDRIIQMRSPVLVRDIALRLKLKPFQVISELMQLGVFAKVTDALEEDVAKRLCGKRGYYFVLEKRVHERATVHAPAPPVKPPKPEEKPEDLKLRPPVVTIM
ncbi:MAG: translation initiation factor IF-2 N-terminal domain-containing protein, partial [Verrucomicrobia bacterium]|nr:translation initiation factor IF-2 N-terminal domain-containing protein [Verrucomicrobiota bacterium]